MMGGAKEMERGGDYESAKRRVREVLLAGDAARGSAPRPHEMVERLSGEWGIAADVGSTALWEMVGDEEVALSDDWRVSLASARPEVP